MLEQVYANSLFYLQRSPLRSYIAAFVSLKSSAGEDLAFFFPLFFLAEQSEFVAPKITIIIVVDILFHFA